MIYVLFFLLITIFIITLYIEKDLFSPVMILQESYILCIGVALLNVKKWNIDLHPKTVSIIIIGNIIFIVTGLFIEFYRIKQKKLNINYREIKKEDRKPINIKKFNIICMLIIQIIIFVLYTYTFYRCVNGFSSLNELSKKINEYRIFESYGKNSSVTSTIPTIITQFLKLSKVFAYISVYIFIHNLMYKKFIDKKYRIEYEYLFSVILFAPLTLLTGARMELAVFILSAFLIWYILGNSFNINKKFEVKKYIKIIAFVATCLILFSITKDLIGRTTSDNKNAFDYISMYFGAPIKLFDMYIREPVEQSDIIGKETFYGINSFLYNIGITENNYLIHLEFRKVNDINLGNVYTAYRNMYQDFGFGGIIILQVILAVILTNLYMDIKENRKQDDIYIKLIMYVMIVRVLFFHAFSEQFFNNVISINYLTLLLLLYVAKWFLTKIKLGGKNEF